MKRILSSFITLILILSSITVSYATETVNYIEYINDDLYVEYIIEESAIQTRATQTKKGKKTANVKNGNTILWSVTVIGTFEYTGSTSICTASSVSTTCPASTWKISSKSASKSGATASAKATAKQYQNGDVINTYTQSVFLVCGSDGTLY